MVSTAPGSLTFVLLQQKVCIQYQFTIWVGKGSRYQLWMCAEVCDNAQLPSACTKSCTGQWLTLWSVPGQSRHWFWVMLSSQEQGRGYFQFSSCSCQIAEYQHFLGALLKLSLWYRGASSIGGGAPSQGRTVMPVSFMQMRWSFSMAGVSLYSGVVSAWCLVLFSAIVCTSLGLFRCGRACEQVQGQVISACQAGVSAQLFCSMV